MCKFKSAIVLKNGDILHNDFTDSHEDLIDLFGLVDNGKEAFVRIEYTTDKRKDVIEFYQLIVDEQSIPYWFKEIKDSVEERMKTLVSGMIIKENQKIIVGRCVILSPGVIIDKVRHCIIQEMRENSHVNVMRENSQVNEMRENSQVNEMRENSHVNMMRENSQVNEMRETTSGSNV